MPYKTGDLFVIEATGDFYPGIACIVTKVHEDDGRILEAKACTPDERLGRLGFINKGEDYIIVEWNWSSN